MAEGDVTQLYNSRGRSQRDGVDSRTMGFYVEGEGVDLAKENAGVPKYRDPHPDDANMIARDIIAAPSAGGSIVTVSYAPPQYVGGSVPPINTFAEGFIGKDVSFEYEDTNIPIYIQTGVLATDANGDLTVKTVYDTGEGGIPFRKAVAYYRVPIAIKLVGSTLNDVFNLTRIILEQTGKIHTIFGQDLVFNCEGIDQQDDETFNAIYRWYKDPGIPNTLFDDFDDPNAGTNLGRIGTYIYPYFDEDFLIEPFKGVSVIGNEDPEQLPRVTFFDKYEREPNGWQSLPGIA
jgi:hypothetical protein